MLRKLLPDYEPIVWSVVFADLVYFWNELTAGAMTWEQVGAAVVVLWLGYLWRGQYTPYKNRPQSGTRHAD